MNEFEFEKNLEQDLVHYFLGEGIKSTRSRSMTELGVNNIQVAFDYQGALEDTRARINGVHEYNSHEGIMQIEINTFRDKKEDHHKRLGQVRALMLNHKHGFEKYAILDIVPQGCTHTEFEETNHDQTLLNFAIKFQIDLSSLDG